MPKTLQFFLSQISHRMAMCGRSTWQEKFEGSDEIKMTNSNQKKSLFVSECGTFFQSKMFFAITVVQVREREKASRRTDVSMDVSTQISPLVTTNRNTWSHTESSYNQIHNRFRKPARPNDVPHIYVFRYHSMETEGSGGVLVWLLLRPLPSKSSIITFRDFSSFADLGEPCHFDLQEERDSFNPSLMLR